MIYLINVILILIWDIISCLISDRRVRRGFLCSVAFIQLLFIAGLRNNVGADFETYSKIFQEINNFTNYGFGIERIEPGYKLLNKLVGLIFGNNFIALSFIVALLTIYFIIKAIYEESYDCFLSIYLFISFCLFYSIMNQSRQSLAIAICLYSLSYLKKKENKKYIIWILVATSIHSSAIVMIILLWLSNIEINKKTLRIYFITSIIVFININVIINILKYTKYSIYLGSGYDISQGKSVIINTVFRLTLLLFSMFFYKKINKNRYVNILYHMALLCTVVQICSIETALFARITTYFFIGYILLLPEIIKNIKKKELKIFLYLGIMVLFGIYHYIYFNSTKSAMGVEYYYNVLF